MNASGNGGDYSVSGSTITYTPSGMSRGESYNLEITSQIKDLNGYDLINPTTIPFRMLGYRIFLSSASIQGDLGYTTMDIICNGESSRPDTTHTYLSLSQDHLNLKPNTKYFHADGSTYLFTTDANGIPPDNIAAPINIWGIHAWWNGCESFTKKGWITGGWGYYMGGMGNSGRTDSKWKLVDPILSTNSSTFCDAYRSVYCAEQ